jgi:hypothetical protein
MDLFDVFASMLTPPATARKRPRNESIAAALALLVLPAIDFCLLTFSELSKSPSVSLFWLPSTFTALSVLVCIRARVSAGPAIMLVLGCAFWCLVCGLTLVVIDILIFPF